MGTSLILSSFKRAALLDRSLYSIARQRPQDLEVVVVNDGIEDDTETVCAKYRDRLDVRYIFSGQRNADGDKWRCSGFALNIGVQQCRYEKIILSCAEIYHINDAINKTIKAMEIKTCALVTPRYMYFDDIGQYTANIEKSDSIGHLTVDKVSVDAVMMPFFMGMWKVAFVGIGGYDEDFTGYSADDNDLMSRLINCGYYYSYTDAIVVHLFHGKRCDSQMHPENPTWAYNYNLFLTRKNQIERNVGRTWGKI